MKILSAYSVQIISEDGCLCMDAMQSCRHVLIFQRKLLAPSSWQMNKC